MQKIIGIKADPWDHGPNSNYIAVLNAGRVECQTQTTTLWGDSLLFSSYGPDQPEYFKSLMTQWSGSPQVWVVLAEIPLAAYLKSGMMSRALAPRPPALPPVAWSHLTLSTAGWDPLKGFWLQFALYPAAFPVEFLPTQEY